MIPRLSVDHSEGKNKQTSMAIELSARFYWKYTELSEQEFLSFCFKDVAWKEHRHTKKK